MRKYLKSSHPFTAKCLVLTATVLAVAASGCATSNGGHGKSRGARLAPHRPSAAHGQRQRLQSEMPEPTPSGKTYYAMARILRAQGKYNEAEFLLLRVLREDPKSLAAYHDLATIEAKQGRVDDALAYLKMGLARFPDNSLLNNNTAVCLMLKGEYEPALTYINKALDVQPANRDYVANHALILALMGRDSEAQDAYARILSSEQTAHNMSVIESLKSGSDGIDADALVAAAELLP